MSNPTPPLSQVRHTLGQGQLPRLEITTPFGTGELYLLGATVTRFQLRGEAPLLFLSGSSRWHAGQPIRGGVPVIFPWFGPKESCPQHGYARTADWQVQAINTRADGSVQVALHCPAVTEVGLDYVVTFGRELVLELTVRNTGATEFHGETCLHTYFTVGDVRAVSLTGLAGATYVDKVAGGARFVADAAPLRITQETDRVYLNTESTVTLDDPSLDRRIEVAKTGSRSTVVWNPWIAKSQKMADFGDDEWPGMICVESGNVADDFLRLPPGGVSTLQVTLRSGPLADG